jgi:anti-sigma-K factor RskA
MKEIEKERLFELLSDQAVFGLNEEESIELAQLSSQFVDRRDDLSFELTAAAISLADLDPNEPLPASLRSQILEGSKQYFNFGEDTRKVSSFPPKTEESVAAETDETVANVYELPPPRRSIWQSLGWAVAAAACIALAVNIWTTRLRPPPEIAQSPVIIQTPTPELSTAQKREQFLVSAQDMIQTSWTSAKNEKEVIGDIVWSNTQQQGYMRFRGLPANDPNRESYQLWIVDETQNQKTPLSGGVFDVSETGEVVIPIDAQLKVKKPKIFAVSKEKSGGVVVSDPSRIVAVAKI